jgi:hypothetical protein
VDRECLSASGDFAIAHAYCDGAGLCVGIGGNPVLARTKHCESHAWRIDLEILALPEVPHASR